jgi:hypothetical protein
MAAKGDEQFKDVDSCRTVGVSKSSMGGTTHNYLCASEVEGNGGCVYLVAVF